MQQSSPSPSLLLAAAASAVAGMVHAAAAGSHAELGTLATLFALTAVAQVGWSVAVVLRGGGRAMVAVGSAIQVGALGTWLVSRTVGISFVDGLGSGQSVGLQDGLVVLLEVVALVAAITSLRPTGAARLLNPLVPGLAVAMVVAAVPAMATPHDHADHAHDDADVATTADLHDDGHDHGEPADDVAADPSPGAQSSDPAVDLPYPASFVSWLDTAETPEQRAAAEKLIVETTKAMEAFPDEAAVQAAGYTSIGDGVTGWEHYIHAGLIADPAILDPNGIESIVLKVHPDGTKEVASAMYLMPFGTTMADVPDIAGDLTVWHDHQNLCWIGARVVGTTDRTGSCEVGEFRPTQPMIHVWLMDHECGPFAGIEGSHGSGCAHDHGSDGAGDEAAGDGHPDH